MRRSSRDLPPNEGSVGELEKVLTVKDCPLCGYKTHKEMLYISERKLAEHIKYFCIGRNAEDAEESDIGVETSDLDYGAIRDANIARNAAFLAAFYNINGELLPKSPAFSLRSGVSVITLMM